VSFLQWLVITKEGDLAVVRASLRHHFAAVPEEFLLEVFAFDYSDSKTLTVHVDAAVARDFIGNLSSNDAYA
jgi:hypothetical protein